MIKIRNIINKIIIELGYHPYKIVTSVYNCEKYLDEYFSSIVNQSLDFKKFIEIIIVDDGSSDNSANIIKKWKKKYPRNIKYIYCKNGGQAKARNLAIKKIKYGFVTFIDGDDFISKDYFQVVNSFLKKNAEVKVVSCNQIFYLESSKETKEHYLSYRFKKKSIIVSPADMKGFIQTTASAVIFKIELIKKHDITFDYRVKPIYEDGHFVNKLFICEPNIKIAFLKKPIYYWRKRESNDSTVDKAWLDKRRFDDALNYGILDLLKKANKKFGIVPIYLQRFALYHISWYFNKIVFKGFTLEFLEDKEIDKFKNLIKEIFSYVAIDTIKKSKLGAMYHKVKLGMLNVYKESSAYDTQVFYIDNYDFSKENITLRYYHQKKLDKSEFKINNRKAQVLSKNTKELFFFEKSFLYQSIIRVKTTNKNNFLVVQDKYENIFFSLNKKRYKNSIKIEEIKENYE